MFCSFFDASIMIKSISPACWANIEIYLVVHLILQSSLSHLHSYLDAILLFMFFHLNINSAAKKKSKENINNCYYYMSEGQVVSVTNCSVKWRVFEPSMNAGFHCDVRSLLCPAFCDANTGPTEFIISIVNSVKMVNMT